MIYAGPGTAIRVDGTVLSEATLDRIHIDRDRNGKNRAKEGMTGAADT
jgi:hypothetical protein